MSCEEEQNKIQALEEEILKLKNENAHLQHERLKLDSMNALFNKYTITSETDLKGFITYVSEPFIAISGYSREELMGKSHNIVRHESMPAEAFKEMWATIKEKKIWRGEVKNRTKNGDYYWVESIVFPILNHNHEIEGYKSIRIDITHKKKLSDVLSGILFEEPNTFNF